MSYQPRFVRPLKGTTRGPCRSWWCSEYVATSGGPHLCSACMVRYLRKHSPMVGALTLCGDGAGAGAVTMCGAAGGLEVKT